MSHKNRIAAKVDSNQAEIVRDLRKLGFTVEVGHDDILVGAKGKTYWFEIKSEDAVGKDGKIRESEKKESQKILERDWKGHYSIVYSTEQIIKEILKEV